MLKFCILEVPILILGEYNKFFGNLIERYYLLFL